MGTHHGTPANGMDLIGGRQPPNPSRLRSTLEAMARPADPARIDAAREAATRNRLIGEHMSEDIADAWLAAWAEQAAHCGLERGSASWEAGWEWIAAQLARGAKP